MPGLNPRQAAFAAAYARCGVASRAAVEAGYSKKTAESQGERLLRNVGVQEEVARLGALATKKAEVDVQRVVDELAIIGFADIRDFVEWGFDPSNPEAPQVRLKQSDKIDAAKARAIVEVSETKFGVRIKFADKLGALDRLGKHLGMFTEGSPEDDEPPPPVSVTIEVVDASVPRAVA